MSIIKKYKKVNPYVMLDKTCLQDVKLSWRAKGIHAYIMGLPEEWEIRVKHLVKQSKEGRDAVYSVMKELIEFGYLVKEEVRTTSGEFKQYNYICYETPISNNNETKEILPLPENPEAAMHGQNNNSNSPLPRNPDTDLPFTQKPDTVNPTLINNKNNNKQNNKLITAAIEGEGNQSNTEPNTFAAADFNFNDQTSKTTGIINIKNKTASVNLIDDNQKNIFMKEDNKPSEVKSVHKQKYPAPYIKPLAGKDTNIEYSLGLTNNQRNAVINRLKASQLPLSLKEIVMHCLSDKTSYTRSGSDFNHKLNVIIKQIREGQFTYVKKQPTSKKWSPPVPRAVTPKTPEQQEKEQYKSLMDGIRQWKVMLSVAPDHNKKYLEAMINDAKRQLRSMSDKTSYPLEIVN